MRNAKGGAFNHLSREARKSDCLTLFEKYSQRKFNFHRAISELLTALQVVPLTATIVFLAKI